MASNGKLVARAVALAVLAARVASAQGGGFDVPVECGSEAEFRRELSRLVGADAERAQPALVAIARESAPEGYRLTLELGGERRELTHADCKVLFRSALVIAAASVRPPAAAEPESVGTAAPPKPQPKAEPEREPAFPKAKSESGESPRIGGSLSGGAGLALGVLPGATGVFELRGALLVGIFGVSLSGKYLLSQFVSTEGRGVDIHAFGLRGAFGVRPIPPLWFSAGLDADLLVGEGSSGIAAPDQDSAWTLAPSLELAVIPINTKHLALEVALQCRYAVQRPVFEVTGFRELYQVPPWGMLSVARGVFHFP